MVTDLIWTSSASCCGCKIFVDDESIYNETLHSLNGTFVVTDLFTLLRSYVYNKLKVSLSIYIWENVSPSDGFESTIHVFTDNTKPSGIEYTLLSCSIIYCTVDLCDGDNFIDFEDFCKDHFLTVLMGRKTTGMGRLEFLHYLGTEAASVLARYSDGTTATFTPPAVKGSDVYTTIDVSPNRFVSEGKTLISFTATAGSRSQTFVIDLDQPDCAPILLFTNSFGVEELLYCTGTHRLSYQFDRHQSSYIRNNRSFVHNSSIKETRKFSADTGYLTVAEQNWATELFRSDYVRVVNFKDGQPVIGKEITITDSKSEVDNSPDELARFTFDYEYAQTNHNVLDLSRPGRIFDNTFDYTFN